MAVTRLVIIALFAVCSLHLLTVSADPVLCSNQAQFQNSDAECPEGNWCCLSTDSPPVTQCCPLGDFATCCLDNQHCCPQNSECMPTGDYCRFLNGTLTPKARFNVGAAAPSRQAARKHSQPEPLSSSFNSSLSNHECPDGRSQCSDSNTCCLLPHGGYGCCVLPDAVCCPDRVHCCPGGYTCGDAATCNVDGGEQRTAVRVAPVAEKLPAEVASNVTEALTRVICPNGQACPDSTTCCPSSSGNYGCCGLPGAICCADMVHCCPSGTYCQGDQCFSSSSSSSFSAKKWRED